MAESVNILPQGTQSPWVKIPAGQMGDPTNDPQTYADMQQNLQNYAQRAQQLSAGNALANLNLQKSLNERDTPVDLSPLMALTDSWTGSKLAPSYKLADTPQSRIAMQQQLQAELDKNQQGMSEQQVQLLKAQLETQARKEDREASLANTKALHDLAAVNHNVARNDKLDERDKKYFDTARTGYMHDTDELRKKKIELSNLNQTLDEALTNPAAANELAIDRARFTVPSRLSDVEINALGYKSMGDLQSRLEQAFESAKSGTITPENYKAIKDNLVLKGNHLEDALQGKAAEHATAYARKTGKKPEDALYELVGDEYGPEVLKPKKAAATASSAPATSGYKVGEIVQGKGGKRYKFNGGDQSNPANFVEQVD